MEDRIIELEIRLAHHEVLLGDLNDVVVRQARELDRLARELALLREQVKAQAELNLAARGEEPPPPHY
ncbi:SlyX protein [Plasticicumulans lactativorans]|uniref:SlyX protein n=1 Tax=Plasticicumulans lactativorans TaxID=1133106 RepID=A0A4V2SCL1_9GAMM|nr:SlyX family protein [Plasticicumulans lactativorans]TCO79740.1 SlyX protein [Plasticicumulans lactativorans]